MDRKEHRFLTDFLTSKRINVQDEEDLDALIGAPESDSDASIASEVSSTAGKSSSKKTTAANTATVNVDDDDDDESGKDKTFIHRTAN